MLLFHCAQCNDLNHIRTHGIDAAEGVRLWISLEEVRDHCTEAVLVVDEKKLPAPARLTEGRAYVRSIPADAIANIDPYLPPEPVTAAGGFVVRPGREEPEVLAIFRRGVWDLPKGKLDEGETIEACAMREVREEVGIANLRMLQSAGTTVHGYAEKGAYKVKTTYWYLMHTTDTEFIPQREEDIEEIAWMPWSSAIDTIGYETLREHMQEITDLVRRVVPVGHEAGRS